MAYHYAYVQCKPIHHQLQTRCSMIRLRALLSLGETLRRHTTHYQPKVGTSYQLEIGDLDIDALASAYHFASSKTVRSVMIVFDLDQLVVIH